MKSFFKVSGVVVLSYSLLNACTSIEDQAKPLKSCEGCPEMITVPKGKYLIGDTTFNEDEQPIKEIAIRKLRVSRFEITVAEYDKFIQEVGYEEQSPCLVMGENGAWYYDEQASWDKPGFEQGPNHPVVCISWQAAKAYINWLNSKLDKTKAPFRLLTESEWEYAAKAGSKSTYWWGDNEEDFCQYTNGADATAFARYPQWLNAGKCNDGHLYTAPVGSYNKPNAFGLEDMVGNVWEWVEDCYVGNYKALSNTGEAQTIFPCEQRTFRGGAWGDYGSFYLRSTYRGAWSGVGAFANLGFRVAQDGAP